MLHRAPHRPPPEHPHPPTAEELVGSETKRVPLLLLVLLVLLV